MAEQTKSKRVAKPVWSEEAQAAAVRDHKYIKIGDKAWKLSLGGAAKMWAKDASLVYVPSLRVVGTPAAIEAKFVEFGVPVADIRAHLAQGYTPASVAGALRAQFEAEVASVAVFGGVVLCHRVLTLCVMSLLPGPDTPARALRSRRRTAPVDR